MELTELNTYSDLENYLLERMDYADSRASKANPSFTKEQSIKWVGLKNL